MATEPVTREEILLAAAAGEEINPPNPITREELFLGKMAGMDVATPTPITRKEIFFQKVIDNGGGGSGAVIKNQNKTITENGEYSADSGYTGLGTVTVAVPDTEPVLQDKQITANGTYAADAGYDGLGEVVVNVQSETSDPVIQPLKVTENGTYEVPDGADGYGPVTVAVPDTEPVLQDKQITANGTYAADAGYDGLGEVVVNVQSEASAPVIQPLEVTENGTYEVPAGADGYGPVTVNVAGSLDESDDILNKVKILETATIFGEVYPKAIKVQIGSLKFIPSYQFVGTTSSSLWGYFAKLDQITSDNWNDISEIFNYAFCTLPLLTSLPDFGAVDTLHENAFYGCTALKEITFTKKTSVFTWSDKAFNNCPALTTINVPWAEDEVTNAPWGATNATINYNYTGEG